MARRINANDRARRIASFAEADDQLSDSLDALDGAVNYRDWICSLVVPHAPGRVLEVGAGHGTMTEAIAAHGDVLALEPSERAAAVLRGRFAGDDRVEVRCGLLDDVTESGFGSVVMINVLEHIADDAAALRACRERLRPGGSLVVWVPAFEALYSDFDARLGHHRRYRRRRLAELARSCGFTVDDCRYVNVVGFFAWWLVARVLRRTPTAGPTLTVFDRLMVPVLRRVEGRLHPPFGQTVLLVAHRPG
jgi:SAM-dependent methyltransferase